MDWAKASNQYGTGNPAQWSGSKFTKRAGVVYLFDNGVAPYVGYSDGFNPSLRNDRQGNNLAPAETKQLEVGIRYQPKDSNTLLSAAVYELSQKNVATRPVGATYFEPTGKVRSRGLELEARSQLSRSVSVLASYTYTDMRLSPAFPPSAMNNCWLRSSGRKPSTALPVKSPRWAWTRLTTTSCGGSGSR